MHQFMRLLRASRHFRAVTMTAVALTVTMGSAYAGTTADSVSWSNLSAGDDWSARVLDSLFPMSGGTETATGTMLQYISAYAMLIAAFWISYASILQVHKTAESGKIFSASFSGWVPLRVVVALGLMVPIPANGGFSVGQALVVQGAKTAIGMARNLTDVVAKSIGPDALPLAEPIIPGTRQVVMAVMESELCRALVNKASNNPDLMPEPKVSNPGNGSPVTVDYSLAVGEATAAATCGSISVTIPQQVEQQMLGSNLDLTDVDTRQVKALQDLISAVRTPMSSLADTIWQTRDVTALRSMDAVLTAQNTSYSSALSEAATAMISKIRAQYSSDGNGSSDAGYVAMKNLGWSGLGAYYLEISRLNAEVLSMSSIVPSVTLPSWQGLGSFLSRDLAGPITAIEQYQAAEEQKLATSDSASAPNGATRLFNNAALPSSGQSALDRVLQALGITNGVMTLIVNHLLSPTSGSDWTDPLGAMIGLGHLLIHTALAIIGGAAVLSSKTGTGLATVANLATGDVPAAIASAGSFALSGLIKALLTPVFAAAFFLLAPGITLAYVLPMTPFAYWMAGVAGWYIVVVEAVVGVPLWMLAHLVFQGEGLHGRGNRGYEVLFTILFRPVMMIAGLVLSYTIFASISWLVMKAFSIATGFVFERGWLLDNFIGLIVLLCMFVTMEMSIAVMCFRLISTLPHHIPAMAGMTSIGRVDSDDFNDKSTGRGIAAPTDKVANIAQQTVSDVSAIGNAQDKVDKGTAEPVDSTTRALMQISGRAED
ncbi:hypothetical protein GLF_2850 [Gluconobacter frateurii NBRC 101659]|nr:hypothetical protein GLF_2850 [Gluconobacter frateurii NBRC 101659]